MTEDRVQLLTDALRKQLSAEVSAEAVAPGRYRFAVVSPKFKDVADLQRQDQIWAIVDSTISRAETLDISLILAFSPDEVGVHSGELLMGLLEKDPAAQARQP
jgi:hypothetical protein